MSPKTSKLEIHTRRGFLSGLGVFLVPTYILSTTKQLNIFNDKKFVVIVEGVPKDRSLRFNSAEEFLNTFKDERTNNICSDLLSKRALSNIKSELKADGHSILITKEYSTYQDFLEFRKVWHTESKHSQVNKNIVYRDVKKYFKIG